MNTLLNLRNPNPPERPFRILSLDGGGVRAILQMRLLSLLKAEIPQLIEQVDMFAGASAGSIVAVALASGLSPEEVQKLWEEEASKIFSQSYFNKFSTLDSAIGSSYSNVELKNMLQRTIGDKLIKDISKKLLVPAFNLDPMVRNTNNISSENRVILRDITTKSIANATNASITTDTCSSTRNSDSFISIKSTSISTTISSECDSNSTTKEETVSPLPIQSRRWRPEFFHNFSNSSNRNTPLVDVCLRSSAAPAYFPIYQGYVDGGTFANNPALAAVITAINSGIGPENIVVLSMSTGNNPKCLPQERYGNGNWGLFEWAPYILDLMVDSSTEAVDFQCQSLLRDRYHRVDPALPADFGLDAAYLIPQLEELASATNLSSSKEWLQKYWIRNNSEPIEIKKESQSWGCLLL